MKKIIGIMNLNQSEFTRILILIGIIYVTLSILSPIFIRNKKNRKRKAKYINSNMQNVDLMKGIEFEEFLLVHLNNNGYKCKLTKATNDYGADLLIEKNNIKTVVQAKRYFKKVGIKAIQEVSGAKGYFKADKTLVITNNYYTKNAIALAKANNVELWNRPRLMQEIKKMHFV